jgi:hypothetical protein
MDRSAARTIDSLFLRNDDESVVICSKESQLKTMEHPTASLILQATFNPDDR